jgi:glycogen debranching enzyme
MTNAVDPNTLERMWELGWTGLAQLRAPLGYHASESETGLYGAIFGRDSLWVVLFLLDIASHRPSLADPVEAAAGRVLSTLASLQGRQVRDATEEQPGKIVHEHWTEEPVPADVHALPMVDGSSYCGFDQTFLFVTAVRRYLDLFPSSDRRPELWTAGRSAIEWIRGWGMDRTTGLYAYRRRHEANPVHQVWKDSFDSVTHAGFDIPPTPLAWIEVQGYAYQALQDAAHLYRTHEGSEDVSDSLRAEAEAIRERADAALWLDDEGCYSVALDADGRAVRMVTSNSGHALWAGLSDPGRARSIAARLLAPDMLTAFGVRTLSASDRFFDPHAYHRGTIWPFDNGVIAAGLIRYGMTEAARSVMASVVTGLSKVGSPVECYVVVPPGAVLAPELPSEGAGELLLHRRAPPVNLTQAFTCGALLYCVSTLAEQDGASLSRRMERG